MSRTVAIVGRPNVGKSALFNRLAGRKISIVHDHPGVTRDRIAAVCKLGNDPFELIDTAGIGANVNAAYPHDARTLVSPISGTTRDAIDIPYERHGNHYVLIDTAGIRPRGKVDNSVEVFSVMRAESSIRRADLCLLVIDATAGVTAQDKKIAG